MAYWSSCCNGKQQFVCGNKVELRPHTERHESRPINVADPFSLLCVLLLLLRRTILKLIQLLIDWGQKRLIRLRSIHSTFSFLVSF